MPSVHLTMRIRERIAERTDQSGAHWYYPSKSQKIQCGQQSLRIHQVWWAMVKTDGTYPARMWRTCDDSRCCNPDHWHDLATEERPPSDADREVKWNQAKGKHYVQCAASGYRYITLTADHAESVELWEVGRQKLAKGIKWAPARVKNRAVTVGQLCTAYRAWLRQRLRENDVTLVHERAMNGVCDRMVSLFGRSTPVETLGPDDFDAAALVIRKDKRAGVVRRWGGFKSVVGKIRHVFTWAVKQAILPATPKFGTKFPGTKIAYEKTYNRISRENGAGSVRSIPPKEFTADEVRALLKHADVFWHARILLGLNCAYENHEISMVRHRELFQTGDGKWWIGENRMKTGGKRLAQVWDETAACLLDAIRHRPAPASAELDERCFLSPRGLPIVPASGNGDFSEEFRKLMKSAGVYRRGRGFRGLRHTFRTNGNPAAHPDIEAVEYVMGHAAPGSSMVPESPTYVQAVAQMRLCRCADELHNWLHNSQPETPETTRVRTLTDLISERPS